MASSASDSERTASPCVSVIICIRDQPDDLTRVIASVRACGNAGQAAEIVVVEETESPRFFTDVRYIHLPPWGGEASDARAMSASAPRCKE